MQSQVSTVLFTTIEGTMLSLGSPLEAAVTERQMAELREAWLVHQVNPLGENELYGVPYSTLND